VVSVVASLVLGLSLLSCNKSPKDISTKVVEQGPCGLGNVFRTDSHEDSRACGLDGVISYCEDIKTGRVNRIMEFNSEELKRGDLKLAKPISRLNLTYNEEFGDLAYIQGNGPYMDVKFPEPIRLINLKFSYPINGPVNVEGNTGCKKINREFPVSSKEAIMEYSKKLLLPCDSKNRGIF